MAVQPASHKRKATTAGLSSSSTRSVKRRASKACQCCRSRKVRCDVVESGTPCTNCRLDEVECCVTEGKRRKKSCIDTDILEGSPIDSVEDRDDNPQIPIFDDIDGLHDLSMPVKNSNSPTGSLSGLEGDLNHHKPHMLYQTQGHRLTSEERTRRLSILSARGIPIQNPAVLTSPFFLPFQLQAEITLPQFLPAIPNRILAEDTDYLQKKGAFIVPEGHLRNELLRCYVQYVHPYLPLLDLEDFVTAVGKNDGSSTISLLLFQAVMFAATAYIDMRHLTAQGYDTRKAARKAFFQRVKLLYDFDYEIDRVTVVQSVLLMTYWYESPDDPKDVWHWLGVAISLARTIGLNCDTSTSPLSPQKQRLWKRIWWSCYMRDRLVALGMRRPIRIKEEESHVLMLEVSDFETHSLAPELNRMLGGCSVMRDSSKREMLAQMCIEVVKCCQIITHVLAAQYSMLGHRLGATQETTMRLVPKKMAADPVEVMQCDRELEMWYESLPAALKYFKDTTPREQNVRNDGEVINLHRSLLTGVYLTTSSALHRPQMMPALPNLVVEPELKELSKKRVREAAGAITDVFRDLYSRDLIRYLPNTGVTILLPAIIVHLLDIKSPDSATRQLSSRRFHFCMQALQKLRDMYASADFAFSFLEQAIRKADVPVHEHGSSKNSYGPITALANQSTATHHATKYGRRFTTTLTPPPELPTMDQIRSRSRASTTPSLTGVPFGINPQAMTLSEGVVRRGSYQAMTPPGSDKFAHMNEVATTGGAAVTLTGFQTMHHSPPTSIHDEQMGTMNGGYVEADRLTDTDYMFENMIDEAAMQQDFDQLINLEGGQTAVDQLFTETLNEVPGMNGNHEIWGLTMPVSEEGSSPTQAEEAVAKLTAAMRDSHELREKIVGLQERKK